MLAAARRRLARRYPTWAEFRALKPGGPPFEPRARRLLTPDAEGAVDAAALNREFDAAYLDDQRKPRRYPAALRNGSTPIPAQPIPRLGRGRR